MVKCQNQYFTVHYGMGAKLHEWMRAIYFQPRHLTEWRSIKLCALSSSIMLLFLARLKRVYLTRWRRTCPWRWLQSRCPPSNSRHLPECPTFWMETSSSPKNQNLFTIMESQREGWGRFQGVDVVKLSSSPNLGKISKFLPIVRFIQGS